MRILLKNILKFLDKITLKETINPYVNAKVNRLKTSITKVSIVLRYYLEDLYFLTQNFIRQISWYNLHNVFCYINCS